jgi:hypothetical protein
MQQAPTLIAVGAILFLLFLFFLVHQCPGRPPKKKQHRHHEAERDRHRDDERDHEKEEEEHGLCNLERTSDLPSTAMFPVVAVRHDHDVAAEPLPTSCPALFTRVADERGVVTAVQWLTNPPVFPGIQVCVCSTVLVCCTLYVTLSIDNNNEDDNERIIRGQIIFVDADGRVSVIQVLRMISFIGDRAVLVAEPRTWQTPRPGYLEIRLGITAAVAQTGILVDESVFSVRTVEV